MRLLPQHIRATAGWMPYIWLIFLSYFIADPAFHRFSLTRLLMTIVGMVVFLTLYFFGYWIEGKRKLWIIVGITLLGILYTPWNWGASGFFIYAAAFAGFCGETELAIAILVVLEAAASTVICYSPRPMGLWVSTSILIAAIGAMNIQHAKRIAAHCRLLVAQEEIEHLAKTAERERIARDLHDVLGHTLSVIILKSELASKLADTNPERAVQEIKDVERISRDALAQVRATIQGYPSSSLQSEAQQ